MAENPPSRETLASRRKRKANFSFREKFSFLFCWDSLFYYGVFVLVIAFLWIGYSLIADSFTQLLNWDYTWQYVPFAYTYWDSWHTFFLTGKFPLYDFSTYIGTDSIGSNSYYGLFDPFVVALAFFPRSIIPQMFAVMTAFKVVVATLLTRCFLKYMGIQEWTARWAALAAGLSGYVSFFIGFPSFVSAACYIPMILWGIEKLLKERKPGVLIGGLFLEGITSFFFLVVVCIFGVMYAVWRYFWTIKTRNKKENWIVIGLGVASFAVALMLASFTILPSLRETMLSGRGSSIGHAYLQSLISSFKNMNWRTFFGLVFEPVGDHPARELMGLLSFFFPTAGHIALPLARSGYDAWTSALFCYTPCVILLFVSIIQSIKQQKISHLLGLLAILFLLFTNSSYYLFYAFSGNGYGRWYIVLIPLIAFYCAWGFDQRMESERWIFIAGGVFALACTIGTFYLSDKLLKGVTFNVNPNGQTYWQASYVSASEIFNGSIHNAWYLYYQLGLIAIEGFLMVFGQKKEWMPKTIVLCVAIEAVVMGNIAYIYDGLWSYKYSFANGGTARDTMSYVASKIKSDDSYYRTYADAYGGTKYAARVAGLNASADFHSLMNFDVEDFALNNHMKTPGSIITTYGGEKFYNNSWSGYYANKRLATDSLLGYRYYEISNSYSAWKDKDGNALFPTANVPFGSEEIEEASPNRDLYRVYRVNEDNRPQLGYAVDSSKLYSLIHKEDSYYTTNFYSRTTGREGFASLLRVEDVERNGAMIESNEDLGEEFSVKSDLTALNYYYSNMYSVTSTYTGHKATATYYVLKDGDLMVPSTDHSYYNEGLGFFLKDGQHKSKETFRQSKTILKDSGIVALTSTEKTYFNDSNDGAYIELRYYNSASSSESGSYNDVPRVYLIGDRFDNDGNLIEENACLSFEYNAFDNARKVESNRAYYGPYSSTFGLYAREGRVKAICICYPGSKTYPTININPSDIYFTVTDYSLYQNEQSKIQDGKLLNVKTSTNMFEFDTNYSESRVVVTQLGYDKGWQVTAKMRDGSKMKCKMLKLDGGLVGFVAPASMDAEGNAETIHYEMIYSTPYSSLSAVLWVIGIGAIAAWHTVDFIATKRKEKSLTNPIEG